MRAVAPFQELAAEAQDLETKARTGLVRMSDLRTTALTGIDPPAVRKAAELLEREADIVATQRAGARDVTARWRAARSAAEREAEDLRASLGLVRARLETERKEVQAGARFLQVARADGDIAAIDGAGQQVTEALGPLPLTRVPTPELVACLSAAIAEAAPVFAFDVNRPNRQRVRHAEAIRGPVFELETANGKVIEAIARMGNNIALIRAVERVPADGSETLEGLSLDLLQQAQRLRDDTRAALRADEPEPLLASADRLGQLTSLLLDGEADLDTLVGCWCASRGERPQPLAEEEPAEAVVELITEDDEAVPGPPAAPIAPIVEEAPAPEDEADPAAETIEQSPSPTAKPSSASAGYHTTSEDDWDWDDVLDPGQPAESVTEEAPVRARERAAADGWIEQLADSGLPRAKMIAGVLRQDLEGEGSEITALLEAAQDEFSTAVSAGIEELEHQPWLPEHPSRIELQAWIERNGPNSALQSQLSRAIDVSDLLSDLNQQIALIAMERDVGVLRATWAQAHSAHHLIEGLLIGLRKVDTAGW